MDQAADRKDAVELAEAADRLGISLATLQTIVEHGFLKAYRNESGSWMVQLEPGDGVPRRLAPVPGGPASGMPVQTGETPRPGGAETPPARDLPPEPAARPEAAVTVSASAAAEAPVAAVPLPEPAFSPPAPLPAEPVAAPAATVTSSAAATTAAGLVERLLTEQIAYLRQQLERREHESLSRDRLVGELASRLAKLSRRGLERPAENDLREQIERVRREQADISARHQRALDSLGDLLLSLRNHLAGRQEAQRSVR